MASESSHHNQQHTKGESESSESTHHVPPPAESHNYPGAGYPPTLGYPPSMGYPPAAPGQYPGYPPPPGYYPYAQAPPAAASAAYYNGGTVVHQQQGHQRSSSLIRCFITTIILVLLFGFTSSIITWVVLRPQFPVFHLDNFWVSNFNATLPSFTANWEANLTVHNPNRILKIEFGQLYSYVYYDEDYRLASANAQPFSLETKKSSVIHAKLEANSKDNLVEKWVVEKLAKERSNGTVSFNFRMLFWTTFRSKVWWKRHLGMEVLCEDIPVTFVGASGNGNFNLAAANGNRDCLVFA